MPGKNFWVAEEHIPIYIGCPQIRFPLLVGQMATIATINVGNAPDDLAVNSSTDRVYVANSSSVSNSVSVIDGIRNEVIRTINVGDNPSGVESISRYSLCWQQRSACSNYTCLYSNVC